MAFRQALKIMGQAPLILNLIISFYIRYFSFHFSGIATLKADPFPT